MYAANEVRGSEEAFGAPEWIVEVSSVALKFGSKAAVDNGEAAALAQKIDHERRRLMRAAQCH